MYPMLFLGLVGAGGIFSGSNPAYTPYEIEHHVRTAQVKFIIVEPELLEPILKGSNGLVDRKDIFIFNVRGQSVPDKFRSWEWLLQHGEQDWIRFTGVEKCRKTSVARLTTSGTTGPPKMAVQSHMNSVAWFTMVHEIRRPEWESRNLYPLPMFHVATVPLVHAGPLRSGSVCYIMRRFELEPYLAGIEKHKITSLGMVPPLVIAIIMSPLRLKYSLKSVRRIGCGAAPLDKDSGERLKALCAPDCTFTQVQGMTETTGAISLFYYPDEDDTGSVGNTFMPNIDVKSVTKTFIWAIRTDNILGSSMMRAKTSPTMVFVANYVSVGLRSSTNTLRTQRLMPILGMRMATLRPAMSCIAILGQENGTSLIGRRLVLSTCNFID
jgi:acyl-CoA synthetase (AMP-forming)/AMP-acid ligase II